MQTYTNNFLQNNGFAFVLERHTKDQLIRMTKDPRNNVPNGFLINRAHARANRK